MNLDRVDSGKSLPNDVNVIIEIPAHADPIKYEVDKATGAMFVDRFMTTAMHYPCNYGYIPQTLADDGDPVDVLVITPFPLTAGVVVRCRPLDGSTTGSDSPLAAATQRLPMKWCCPSPARQPPSIVASLVPVVRPIIGAARGGLNRTLAYTRRPWEEAFNGS